MRQFAHTTTLALRKENSVNSQMGNFGVLTHSTRYTDSGNSKREKMVIIQVRRREEGGLEQIQSNGRSASCNEGEHRSRSDVQRALCLGVFPHHQIIVD